MSDHKVVEPIYPAQPRPSENYSAKQRPTFQALFYIGAALPNGAQGDYGYLTYDKRHEVCRKRSVLRMDSKAASKTRLPMPDAMGRKCSRDAEDAIGPPEDAPEVWEKGRRVGDLHLALVSDKEVVQEQAQCRDPRIQ